LKEEKDLKTEETKQSGEVSRRDFLVGAGTVVVGGAVGAGLLSSCNGGEEKTVTTTKTVEKTVTVSDGATATVTETKTVGGEGAITVTETKTVSDGSSGVLEPWQEPERGYVYATKTPTQFEVKNGRIIRCRRIRFNDHNPDIKQWSVTARGATWKAPLKSSCSPYYLMNKTRQTSANRIPYPLQRVDWEPGGDPAKINAHMRGRSGYKRISWDEAATIIASEMKRVADTYGGEAVSCARSGHHHEGGGITGTTTTVDKLLLHWTIANYGYEHASTERDDQGNSFAGGQTGGRWVLGSDYEATDHFKDILENCELLMAWPSDASQKTWIGANGIAIAALNRYVHHDVKIRQVYVTPEFNRSCKFAYKWVPVIPQTDAILALAIAYIWLKEGTYDQAYLDTHTIGFSEFKKYVLGEDGSGEKTPELASEHTGIPVWTIKAIAREWARVPTSTLYGGQGGGVACRNIYAHETQRLQIYLKCMQGLGKPGIHQCRYYGVPMGNPAKNPAVTAYAATNIMNANIAKDTGKRLNMQDRDRPMIPSGRWRAAMLEPSVTWYNREDQFFKRTYPMPGKSRIRLMWAAGGSFTGSDQHGHGAQLGLQSPELECYINSNIYLEDTTAYADIILPITQQLERPEIGNNGWAYKAFAANKEPIVKPFYEAKTDFEQCCIVAEKLGFLDKLLEGKTYQQFVDDNLKEAYEKSGVTDMISWDELAEGKALCQAPVEGWYDTEPYFHKFYNDPKKYPLNTESGLLEIVSGKLQENFPDDKERSGLAKWVRGGPPEDGWAHDEDRFISKNKDKYTLVMMSNTSAWKYHSMFSDQPWSREIEKVVGWDGYAYAPVLINPEDAAARGIEAGDIVHYYNDRGGVLGGAVVTHRMVKGAIGAEKAGGGHHIIPGKLHRGGNPNAINPDHNHSITAYGGAYTGFLIELEKVTMAMMEGWKAEYPEAFARGPENGGKYSKVYDPAYGPFAAGWIEGGI